MSNRDLGIRLIDNSESANAFLLGLIFNQGQKAERAWNAPYLLKQRIGTLDPEKISKMHLSHLIKAVSEKPALHPFVQQMSRSVGSACKLLINEYAGDARSVWSGGKTVTQILKELQRFSGIGKHKAIIGVFLLRRHHRIFIRPDGTRLNIRGVCPRLFELYGEDE